MQNTQDEIPSTNDMITYGNSKEPNKYSYTKMYIIFINISIY